MAETEAQDPLRLSCNCPHASRSNLYSSGCPGKGVEQFAKYTKARQFWWGWGDDSCLYAPSRAAEVLLKPRQHWSRLRWQDLLKGKTRPKKVSLQARLCSYKTSVLEWPKSMILNIVFACRWEEMVGRRQESGVTHPAENPKMQGSASHKNMHKQNAVHHSEEFTHLRLRRSSGSTGQKVSAYTGRN